MLLVALLAAGALMAWDAGRGGPPAPRHAQARTVAPQPAREVATALPAYAVAGGDGSPQLIPGVYSARRVVFLADTGQMASIELAMAQPLLVQSAAGAVQKQSRPDRADLR